MKVKCINQNNYKDITVDNEYEVVEILENFYPLEINESNNFIEGIIRKYTLKEIVKM